jgi:hypothetical protein
MTQENGKFIFIVFSLSNRDKGGSIPQLATTFFKSGYRG